jgi:glyoxylase-like metal-dependent hydrolase (beta-lactamase superfamily II)
LAANKSGNRAATASERPLRQELLTDRGEPMRRRLIPAILVSLAAPAIAGAQNFDDVELETTAVAGSVHAIYGRGGNIGVSAGSDGVFLIDDQFAPLSYKIKAEVAALGAGEVRFIVNTHWHFDHTGGNEIFSGDGALIVAHHNVRERMSGDQFIEAFDREVPASPESALPVVTFDDGVTFHLNDDEIRVIHVPAAHTDGDAIVYFRNSNVIHTGDIYFAGIYPFIDTSAHGSVNGVIDAAQNVLSIINDDTKVIPLDMDHYQTKQN